MLTLITAIIAFTAGVLVMAVFAARRSYQMQEDIYELAHELDIAKSRINKAISRVTPNAAWVDKKMARILLGEE